MNMRPRPAKRTGDVVLDTGYRKFLYRVTLLAGIIGPLGNIPQIVKIFTTRNVAGVSLLTRIIPVIFGIPFILWGISRRDLPVTVTYSLWFLTSSIVAIGTVIYGGTL